jgi:hypothetical protein
MGLALLSVQPAATRADQIEMVNGDRYQGKIISLNSNEVVMNSDMLGLVKVPRAKVSGIVAGVPTTTAPTAAAAPAVQTAAPVLGSRVITAAAKTNAAPAISLSELQTNAALAKQVQAKYLADVGPEATAKYNEMLRDLFSGKMSIGDLRNQAKSAADQLRSYKKELGSEAGSELDEYLVILDKFIKEGGEDTTTSPAPALKKAPVPNQ